MILVMTGSNVSKSRKMHVSNRILKVANLNYPFIPLHYLKATRISEGKAEN